MDYERCLRFDINRTVNFLWNTPRVQTLASSDSLEDAVASIGNMEDFYGNDLRIDEVDLRSGNEECVVMSHSDRPSSQQAAPMRSADFNHALNVLEGFARRFDSVQADKVMAVINATLEAQLLAAPSAGLCDALRDAVLALMLTKTYFEKLNSGEGDFVETAKHLNSFLRRALSKCCRCLRRLPAS